MGTNITNVLLLVQFNILEIESQVHCIMGNSKSVSRLYLAHFFKCSILAYSVYTVVLLLLLLRAILDMCLEHAVSLLWSSRRLVWVWDEEDDLQTAVFIYFRTLRCTSFTSRWPSGQTRLWITSFLLNKGSQWCNWPQILFCGSYYICFH